MGIEKTPKGVYVPDKSTKWPSMKDEERSKVYKSHKEKYAGTLAEYKHERDEASESFWDSVINDFQYTNEFNANDSKLKGMPVSMALLLSIRGQFDTRGGEDLGLKGKGRNMMMYCLDYLQNAPENVSLRKENYPNGNIDKVPRNGFIKIEKTAEDRWMLKIQDENHETLFAGFIFPY